MASKAGKTFQGVRSELWQRLRAARAYADKTQLDVAKHVLIYSRVPTALPEMATSAANVFGIDCRVVSTVDEASSFLLSL